MPLMGSSEDWSQLRKEISELEDMPIETSKTEMQTERKKKV